MEEEINYWEELGKVFFIVLVIASIFELGLLAFAYFNADKVECNLLWCTFTTQKNIIVENSYSESRCYVNGKRVNCTSIDNRDNVFTYP